MLAEPFNVIRRLDAISTRRGGAERGPSILPKGKVVFVVDDDPGTLKGVKRLLREHGFDCVLFQSAEALKKYFFLFLQNNFLTGRRPRSRAEHKIYWKWPSCAE